MDYRQQNWGAGWQPQYQQPGAIGYGVPQYHQESVIPKVRGEQGAKEYPFGAPNGSVLLLDESDPIVWLRMNDELGHPTVRGYSIEPLPVSEPMTQDAMMESIMSRLDEIERKIDNGKSDTRGNGSNGKSGNQRNGQQHSNGDSESK